MEFDTELVVYVAVVATAAAAIGRLLAVDTVLGPARERLLVAIAGRSAREAALMEKQGLRAPKLHLSGWRAWLLDGLTCPSCEAFWASAAIHLMLPYVSDQLPAWEDGVVVFAIWGVAQLLIKIRG